MAKYSNTVEYNINTKLDSSGLTKLQAQIKQLENSMQQMSNRELIDEEKVRSAKTQLERLNAALTNSFNSSLGILDLSKFRAELDSSGVSASGLQSAFNMMGAEGQAALNGLTTQIADFNGGMERTSSAVDKIFTTFSNTFRWGLISSFFSNFMNSIHQSVDYVKELDDSLTQIMLVTDYNRDAMNQYAKSANEAAKAVSMTTTGMTNASLVFAQQGYNLNQSQELATLSAKLANASQQDTATTSDQITAYMNAYGLQDNIAELSQAMDNWALIANVSAADVSELAQASQRAASMANTVGVSGEQLAAQIATIESVTREAPEQIGNGLKTLYARFSDISQGGEDEEGVKLGDVTQELNKIGVQVLDQFGNIRDIGDIMEDLMVIWDDLDQTSKIAAAQSLAGKYQVNRFVSLMDNSDMYREYLGATGGVATGTLDQMNQEYADSIAGRSAKLQASLEGLFSTIFNTDDIYPWMDAAQGAIDLLQQFFDALGGGKTVLLSITSLLTQAFSQNIARSINDTIANRNLGQVRQQNIDTVGDTLDRVGIDRTQGVGKYIKDTADQAKLGALSDAQYDAYMNNVRQWADASTALAQSEEELTNSINTVNLVFGKVTGETEAAILSKDGLNTFSATENRASLSNKEIMQRIQGTDFSDVASQAQVVSLALTKVQSQFDTTTKDSEELGHSIDWVQDQLHTLSTEMNGYSSTSADNMIQALQQMRIELDESGKLSETSAKQLQKYIREMQQLSVIAANMDETSARRVMADAGDSAQRIKGNVDFNRTQEERAGRNARDRQKGIDDQQRIKGILDTVSAIQQLTSAWQIAANLPAILDDEDLDVSEKMTQLIMNLTPVIMMSTNAFKAMKDAAKTFAAAEGEATIATELLGGALTFLTSGPGIALVAALAAIGFAIHAQAEEAKKAHEQAMADFEEAKNIQQQATDLSSQIDDWQSKRNEQGNTQELAQEADTFADSLKELGNEEEAAAIHLAAVRAEVLGTSESFEELDKVMEKAQFDAQNNIDLATMEAANAILKDRLSTAEELAAANNDLQNSALDYNLRQASKTNGWEMGVLNTPGDDDIRAATMDWQSLNSILEKSVPGFAEIADENERLSLALAHTSDEAQRAAIQIQQMLNTSNTLSNDQKTGITRQLESAGFSAQEALQVIASLNIDEETSYNNIVPEIQDIIHRVNEDKENLSVVLQAKMDPEQVKETVKSQIATYEPKDEDVDKEEFDSLADTFYENKSQMGVEGTPFEDFSEGLFENAAALEDVIEGILRYNDAIESLDENYDNWKDALENTNELSTEHLQVVEELQETYSDFLGLSRNVSKRFASNAENLELMQAAAEGNTEAFEDLEDAAAADIYMQVTGLEDLDAAQQKIEEINDILANSGIEEIPVGEIFNLDDFESVRSAIDSELQTLGLNAEQAAQYVSDVWHLDIPADQFTVIDDDMNAAAASAESTATHVAGVVEGVTDTVLDNANYSVSTNIDSDTAEATDTVTFTNLTPQPIGPVPITSMMPVGNGNTGVGGGVHMEPFVAETYGVGYTPETHTTEQLKQQTGFKEDVKAEKGGNGHVSLPSGSGAQGSRRPSGGSGRSGVSRPSSRGGGGGSCFVAGTPVSMLGYYKNIEEIQVGDIVLSYNEQIKEPEFSQVVQTMIHDVVEPIYTLYIKDEQLRVTGIHRFLITNNIITPNPQWICAEDLHIGDWVLFADGTWHVIHKIEINIEHQIVYNFEVSGNHNYYVGYNQILAHNKGGGGSGGSKAKTIEPKEKKTHQKDYYEEVSGQLDKTEKILSKIEKEEDRLIGDKARANQNKQLELLQKEIDLNKEKQKIQQQELKDIDAEIKEQDRLAESIARTGGVYDSIPDAVFDEDGIVANYEQISAAIDNIHNKLIDQYNAAAAAGNEDLTKELSKTIEKFDKYGENILKSAQRHNKLQSEIEGTINELEELQDTIEDIRIDAWKASTEAIDNLKDLRENAAELEGFFSGYESDSPFRDLVIESEKLNNIWSIGKDQAKAYYDEIIADKQKALKLTTDKAEQAAIKNSIDYFKTLRDNLSGQGLNNGLLGLAYQDMLQLKEWYDNPSAKDNVFGNNTAELKEAYEEAYDRVREMLLDYEKEINNYRDSIIDAYDEIEDKQDRQIDKFDRVVDKLETFSDMYSLYYGDESYGVVRDILQQQGNTLREQLNAQKEIYSYWSEAYAQAIKVGDEKLIQELEDKMHDAEDRMTELAKDAAEAFADSYEKAVKASTQYIIQNTIGDRNFDRLDRNWEWDQQYIEKYRDDVEKAYEMDKLRNKYTDLLNQAQGASLQTQDRIRAQMQEQLDLLDGQATVSEYDVKLANAKLEILQKQIALEDAQRNKNRMQLRRDTQGNYRYVYTADQESVRGAQQDLLDSEYDAYELSKNQQISNYDNLINAYQKYLSQREEILNNANLSEAEKLAQNAELYDKFLKFVDAAKEDFSDAAFGTLDILNWLTLNGTKYTTSAAVEMLNNLLDEQGMIKDETGIIWMDNATYLTEEVIPKISNAVAEADEDIKNRLNELQENIVGDNGVFPAIRNGIEGPDGLVNALEDARTSTQSLTVATRDLMEALTGDNGALAEAQAQLQKYQKELDNVKNASAITAQQLRDTQKALDKSQAESLNYRTMLDDIAAGKRDKNGNLIDNNAKKNGATANKNWNAKNDAYEIWINGKWGGGKEWWAPYVKDNHTEAQAYAVLDLFNRGYGYNWGFDTGGYTGTWNYKEGLDKVKNGKLAVLHQKELVLNEEDTQNILAAVDMVRKIGVGLRNNIANVDSFSGKNLSTFGDTIEQRVEITATFPNATDANDIRQAIMGLADKAYQYSHRNR